MFFFPFVGGGHQIPMIDTARVFASHGAKSTITATPNSAPLFQNSILRDQQIGRQISIHALRLPEGVVSPDADMSATGFTNTSILQEPLRLFLLDRRPDCIIVDLFLGWAAELIDELRIRRVFFIGSGIFSRCVTENLRRYAPQEKVGSDHEPFLVQGLPDPIMLMRSQLPPFAREKSALVERFRKAEETSIGSLTSVPGVLNSEKMGVDETMGVDDGLVDEGTLEFSGTETMGVDDGSVSMVKKFLERCEMRRS